MGIPRVLMDPDAVALFSCRTVMKMGGSQICNMAEQRKDV